MCHGKILQESSSLVPSCLIRNKQCPHPLYPNHVALFCKKYQAFSKTFPSTEFLPQRDSSPSLSSALRLF